MANWLTALLAGLAGGIISIAIMFVFFVPAPWESIGALSGWAAAIGTVSAALITLVPLRAQLREARRQTDFILGDSAPSLHINPIHSWEDKKIAVAKITNWNRRPLHLQELYFWTENNSEIDVYEFFVGESARDPRAFMFDKGIFNVPLVLDGWLDRASPPPEASIHIGMSIGRFVYSDNSYPSTLRVKINASIIDAIHKNIELFSTCKIQLYTK